MPVSVHVLGCIERKGGDAYLGIMDEGSSFAVWRQLTCRSILETFNDGSFTGTIVTNDERQRGVELDGFTNRGAEGANSRNGELVYSRHVDEGLS